MIQRRRRRRRRRLLLLLWSTTTTILLLKLENGIDGFRHGNKEKENDRTIRKEDDKEDETDKQWMEWLIHPSAEAKNVAVALTERANRLMNEETILSNDSFVGELDVVVSGGGNLDAFYMGVHMILSRANRTTKGGWNVRRWSGASAGGMMPFELLLRGETEVLTEHISYGKMTETFPDRYRWSLQASALQDHHWRLMSTWMCNKYNQTLSTVLNNRMFLALSCLHPILPKQIIVSQYKDSKQAQSAFMGTGTVFEWYDGMACSDGGAMSGKDMTPLFRDDRRPQLIVDLMKTGFPESLVFKYNVSQAKALVEHGQDVALALLTCGATKQTCWTDALHLCPKGNATLDQICSILPPPAPNTNK